jgi:hypothetical protein
MTVAVVRSALVLVLVVAVVSVLTGGPMRVSLSPDPAKIVTHPQTEYSLPKGTKLKLGYADDPLVIAYDKKGRVVVTPPKEKTLIDVFQDTLDHVSSLKAREGAAVASRDPTGSDSQE